MPKTLTPIGVTKIGRRLADSIHHAAYTINGAPKTIPIFRKLVDEEDATVRLYVYFDDTVVGEVANVQLVDDDGDVVAEAPHTFTKPANKGLYVAFRYHVIEMEVESGDETI